MGSANIVCRSRPPRPYRQYDGPLPHCSPWRELPAPSHGLRPRFAMQGEPAGTRVEPMRRGPLQNGLHDRKIPWVDHEYPRASPRMRPPRRTIRAAPFAATHGTCPCPTQGREARKRPALHPDHLHPAHDPLQATRWPPRRQGLPPVPCCIAHPPERPGAGHARPTPPSQWPGSAPPTAPAACRHGPALDTSMAVHAAMAPRHHPHKFVLC